MNLDRLEKMVELWADVKSSEQKAIKMRREIEDEILDFLAIPKNLDGALTRQLPSGTTLKVVGKMARKVDSKMVQDLAVECGLSHHLSSLFRWTPELNLAVWKATDKKITDQLAGAITTTPGRASFSITQKED
jgi:hypothetical protein